MEKKPIDLSKGLPPLYTEEGKEERWERFYRENGLTTESSGTKGEGNINSKWINCNKLKKWHLIIRLQINFFLNLKYYFVSSMCLLYNWSCGEMFHDIQV